MDAKIILALTHQQLAVQFIAGVAHIGVGSVGASQARDEFYGLAERNGHVLFHEFCQWCFDRHVAEEGYTGQEEEEEERAATLDAGAGAEEGVFLCSFYTILHSCFALFMLCLRSF